MQAQTYEGYFENGNFFTAGKLVRIPENKRVLVTVLDEPAKINTHSDEQERRTAWLKRLDEAIKESTGEELIYTPRSQEMRSPLDISDREQYSKIGNNFVRHLCAIDTKVSYKLQKSTKSKTTKNGTITGFTRDCQNSQKGNIDLAKVEVASSSLVIRSGNTSRKP